MTEELGYELVRRTACFSAAFSLLVAPVAWWRGAPSVAWGYTGGVALGLVSLTGLAWMVYHAIAPRGREGRPRRGAAIPLLAQLLKYAVLIAGLYLLVAHFRLNEWAIFCGLLTPVALATVLALRLGVRRHLTGTGR